MEVAPPEAFSPASARTKPATSGLEKLSRWPSNVAVPCNEREPIVTPTWYVSALRSVARPLKLALPREPFQSPLRSTRVESWALTTEGGRAKAKATRTALVRIMGFPRRFRSQGGGQETQATEEPWLSWGRSFWAGRPESEAGRPELKAGRPELE